mmetsp:Transcript_2633/g.8813  ORF Transcript_2633/g.8813 Transcript_2633/m.8813 type:complete len:126 (+) Transcript_2633:79-456(+)
MRCLKSFSVHQKDSQPSSVYTAHVHPHGNWLATGGADNHVKIWDLPRMLARTSIAQIPHDVDAVVHDSLLPRCPPAALPERALCDRGVTTLIAVAQSGTFGEAFEGSQLREVVKHWPVQPELSYA